MVDISIDLGEARTRADFAALLHARWVERNTTLRQLADRVGSSPTTLSGWFRGANLPRSHDPRFRRLLAELGEHDPEPWIATLARLQRHGASVAVPYPGLASFGAGDADWFFGRDDVVDEAVRRVRALDGDGGRLRVLWLVGASGAGKSSVLHAGLGPRLAAGGSTVVALTPGDRPVERLAGALAGPLAVSPEAALAGLRDGPAGWVASLDGSGPRARRLVVAIDQYEELFRACDDRDERALFVDALVALAQPGAGTVVAGLRVEFYHHLVGDDRLAPSLEYGQLIVGPLRPPQVQAAIEEPARRAGFAIEPELVSVLLDDLVPPGAPGGTHDPGALPLLAHALRETWNRARRREMTVRDYVAAGGIAGVVERTAEAICATLAPDELELVRQVFLRLVHVEDGGVATRRVAPLAELQALVAPDPAPAGESAPPAGDGARPGDGDRPAVGDIVDRFVDARLLTAREATVEITHESLLAAWPRLAAWIEGARDALRVHRSVTEAARAWRAAGDDPESLATGVRLEAMASYAADPAPDVPLNQDERAFVAASVARAAAAERARRRHARRLRASAAVATVCALLAASLAVAFAEARAAAVAARDDALSRQIAVKAEQLRATDPTLAAQLAVAGYDIAPTSEARAALLGSSAVPVPTRHAGGPGSTALAISRLGGLLAVSNSDDGTVALHVPTGEGDLARAGSIDLGVPDLEIYALALTPDDRTLVVGDAGSDITLWDVGDPGRPRRIGPVLHGPARAIQALAVDPSGTEVAAVGEGDGVFRWDIRDPARPRPLPLLPVPDITWGVAYRPDGGQLAVGVETGEAQVWDLGADPAVALVLPVGDGSVFDVAFSPDGDTVATGSRGGTLAVWDLSRPAPRPVEVSDAQFESWVNTVAFSPDGDRLVAGSSDLSLRVWDTTTWAPPHTLPHPAALTQAVFVRRDGRLVTAAVDGTVRLWDLDATVPVRVPGRIWGLGYSDDGARFAAFSGEAAGLWDAADLHGAPLGEVGVPEGADDPLSGGSAMSDDGRLLALGTRPGPVYLVDVADPARPKLVDDPLTGPRDLVEVVAFAPGGGLLAAGGRDHDVHIWDISDPGAARRVAVLDDAAESVLDLAWSPSGTQLGVASADNRVYLYDLADPRAPALLARLGGFDSEAYAVAFRPDGGVLATAGSDTTVILWDISEPAEPRRLGEPLGGPTARVYDLAFDPAGERLAAAVVDGTAWLWDVHDPADPERRAVLGPVGVPLSVVHFAPDGETLASGDADGRVHVWSLDEGAVADAVCASAGEPLTAAEWETHLPGAGFVPPCPR